MGYVFRRNPRTEVLEAYTEDGRYLGPFVTMSALISAKNALLREDREPAPGGREAGFFHGRWEDESLEELRF